MIFYFTGTGNSGFIANQIAEKTDDKAYNISDIIKEGYKEVFNAGDNESIGFVFPIYAWGLPKPVIEFINKVKLINYKNNYIYAVATCGANTGFAVDRLGQFLKTKGMNLSGGFSVVMPNNYILMGDDVDTQDAQKIIFQKADVHLATIVDNINHKNKVFDIEKGKHPFLCTYVVHPLFNKFSIKPKKFKVTDCCLSCGMCEKVCPVGNIHTVDGKPQWGKECVQCLACINYCPAKAVQYGKGTVDKGRYTNPYFKR